MILDRENIIIYIRLLVLKNAFVSSQPNMPSKRKRKILHGISEADPGGDIKFVF